ncbi:hypothetical protein [Promicromonospora aerolata]|uniref:Uncharacterized protein n=1 Tax=Promicromonospora aerolata TaxID=195749 RepID=A0ABW4V400_9MICO
MVFNPDRWVHELQDVLTEDFIRLALESDDTTTLVGLGQRSVTRHTINWLADSTDLTDDDQVLSLWLLVLAWGNGKQSRWGFQNAAKSLAQPGALLDNLRQTSAILRAAANTSELATAYRAWRPGLSVGESFFSKWFTFAGRQDGRNWQPLILDENIWNTLNQTLELTVSELAGSRQPAAKYQAYVEAVHEWAGSPSRAQWIEWVLFSRDGK